MRILTNDGFKEFDGFVNTGVKDTFTIVAGKDTIEVTGDHRFLMVDGNWIEALDLQIGDILSTGQSITSIEECYPQEVYDAVNVADGHAYWTNGMISHNCSYLYIDEAAFIRGYEEFFTSVYPTISSGKQTKLLITSTPNGLNHFHETWTGAEQGLNGYANVRVTWDMVPGRDEAWKEETLKAINFDRQKFSQEYECRFLGSSGSLIEGAVLEHMKWQEPIFLDENGDFRVFEQAQKNKVYALVADVSRGKGLDYSAFNVMDITSLPYQQVATFRNNTINSFDYADMINRIATIYNNAAVLVEVNDLGQQVADFLFDDFEYDNLIYTQNKGRNKIISAGFGGNIDRGVRTTATVKGIGCSMLKLLVERNQLVVNDERTVDELKVFSKSGASYGAEQGKHDDLVMGLVLFSWMTQQGYFKDMTNIHTFNALRERNTAFIDNELIPFFIDNGVDEAPLGSHGHDHDEEFSW